MKIVIDIDELRSISILSGNAANKMDEANIKVQSVISKHDWKCPERVAIDESLGRIKENVSVLNDAFVDFASQITEIANDYTELNNSESRFDTEYMDSLATLLTELSSDGAASIETQGGNFHDIVSDLESVSLDTANIASLHGCEHGINIMDFTLFYE